MPIDIIKIDRSFVRDITTDPTDATMIRTFLRELECNYAQGFLFSKTVPYAEFIRYAQTIRGSG